MAERVCESCQGELPLSDFPLVRPGKPWRRRTCRACVGGYQKRWKNENRDRVRQSWRAQYQRQKGAMKALNVSLGDLDVIRRALVEHPETIQGDEAAAAYFRGFLAGAGRAKREAEEVEGLKDLVFRIAQDFNVRWGNARVRLSYEDLVSVGYEALLDCMRKKRRDRPLVATVIRRRITDALRERFGREFQSVHETTNQHGDEDTPGALAVVSEAVPDEVEQTDLMETVLAAMPDERAREIVMRRAQGESLSEIGRSLGLTESRACQIFGDLKPLVAAACGFDS